jgi:hypothetical protein
MKKFIVLFAVILLAGCSTKFAYKNADWLVHWFIDDYVDMTREQKRQFDQNFEDWMNWHRDTQLPLYLLHFEELASDINTQNITIDRMEYHQEKARGHWLRVREHLTPDLAKLAATLSTAQVDELFKNLEEKNVEDEEERAERAEQSPEKRRDRWVKRNKDNIENWLGKLSPEQERLIEDQYNNFTSNGLMWVEYRRNYQAAIKEVFNAPDREDAFEQAMIELLNNPDVFRSQEMLDRSAANEYASKQYLLTLFNFTNEKQRQHMIEELNDWRDDVVELMR